MHKVDDQSGAVDHIVGKLVVKQDACDRVGQRAVDLQRHRVERVGAALRVEARRVVV